MSAHLAFVVLIKEISCLYAAVLRTINVSLKHMIYMTVIVSEQRKTNYLPIFGLNVKC